MHKMRFPIAAFAFMVAAGCIDGGCPTEVTVKWTDRDLYREASLLEHGIEPVAVDTWLRTNGSTEDGPWRLVNVVEIGDGWMIHLRALPQGTIIFLNVDSNTSELAEGGNSAFGHFLQAIAGWNETGAGDWLDANPIRPGQAVAFDYDVWLPEPLTWSGPHNGFWQSAQDGQITYERSRPHLEARGDGERLAMDEAGQVAWWGHVDGGIGMRSRAIDRADTMMARLGLNGSVPGSARIVGSPGC